jgi:hypothetical protein
MTTRTVKMFGLAYGSTPAEIAVTLDGESIYTGTVTTSDAVLPMTYENLVDTTIELCNFEIPVDFEGTKSMTCSVTNGTVIFAQINTNYCLIGNSVGSGPDVYHSTNSTGDARSNVSIDGVIQQVEHDELSAGTWWFKVYSGSTMTHNLIINAGTANVAPV